MEHYYHLFANGDDAKDFITSNKDFEASFNRFAVCAAQCKKVRVLAFSIEETHPHSLIYGEYEDCILFKQRYEALTFSYIIGSRGSKDGVVFELELSEITDAEYLLNAAAYILVQPTKDGKQVMPYDYRWGTASMYFRPEGYPSIWNFDSDWTISQCKEINSISLRAQYRLSHTKITLPGHWLVCNNLILPTNYIDKTLFESIFGTYNRFRTFMSAGKNQQQIVLDKMSQARGVNIHDIEARKISQTVSGKLFGKQDSRWLSPPQRLQLAKELRFKHQLSIRQIAILSRLPEQEIRKYIK